MRPLRHVVALAIACLLAGCAGWLPAAGRNEPAVVEYHAEDDQVRIEERRVRGQLTRASVSPKAEGVANYEVLPPTAGQDPSKNHDSAGQRVWSVMTF